MGLERAEYPLDCSISTKIAGEPKWLCPISHRFSLLFGQTAILPEKSPAELSINSLRNVP